MKTTVVVVSLVAGSIFGVATPAGAVGWTCAKTATVLKVVDQTSDGSGVIQRFGQESPTGAPWTPKKGDDTFVRNHFYELRGVQVILSFGGVIESLSKGSVVMLSCSGVAKGDPLDVPNLRMLNGTVDIQTTDSVPASVTTEEGLFGPVPQVTKPRTPATHYQVSRELKSSNVSLLHVLWWFADYANQPSGTTTTKVLAKAEKVNVTPYVGPQPGSCRHVTSATLKTTTSAGHGTAIYN